VIQGLDHRANKLCHNEQDNWTFGFSEEGNLWIQLLAKNPDTERRIPLTTNLCIICKPYIRGISYQSK